jgi:hypothetical protein
MPDDKKNKPTQLHPNNRRPSGTGRRDLSTMPRDTATWAEVDTQLLRDAVVAVADKGAAIQFGKTSDGGALSVRVYDGNDALKDYPRSLEDVEKSLRWVVSMYSDD